MLLHNGRPDNPPGGNSALPGGEPAALHKEALTATV